MSDIKEILDTIAGLEDEFKLVVNIGGIVLVMGKQVAQILSNKGAMTQIQYIEIVKDIDDRDAIARAKLQAYIDS